MDYQITINNRLPVLKDIFSNKSEAVIVEVINIVEAESPDFSPDEKFEAMINLLTETGDSTVSDDDIHRDNTYEDDDDDDDEYDDAEGAVGYLNQTHEFYNQLQNLYPSMNKNDLRRKVNRKYYHNINDVIDEIEAEGYVPEKLNELDVFQNLQEFLPNADPDFLRQKACEFIDKDETVIRQFVDDALENNDYPTKEEYLKRQKELSEWDKYIVNFNINNYLNIIPNPVEKYGDNKRELILVSDHITEFDIQFVRLNLYNKYKYLRTKYIDAVFKPNINLINICNRLDRLPKSLRTPRAQQVIENITNNIELLQLVAYVNHSRQIKNFIKSKNKNYQEAKEQAKLCGLLEKCKVCGEDELIPEECFFCRKGCVYCKDCLKQGIEVAIGEENIDFPCYYCDSYFSLRTLETVLERRTFEKLEQRIQNEELRKANLEGTDTCPFCDSVQLLTQANKIFKCQNPDCLKESCRLCKHESHIPKRCNEIEYDEDVKRRTYIENKMSEALMRTCYSCNKKFIKDHGCNKMTCSCGAKMCYLCGAGNIDYNHFGSNRCVLHSDDLTTLHLQRVRQGAQQAKQELGDVLIKFDPEDNLEAFFN